MTNVFLTINTTNLVASIIYTILTLCFILGPFLVFYLKYKENKKIKEKYIDVFPSETEAYNAYDRATYNTYVEPPYRTRSLIAICYYFGVFYIVSEIVGSIAIVLYLAVNGFDSQIINPDSPLFNQNVYDHMFITLTLILEIIIYSMGIVGVLIIMWKPFKEDLKRINGKTFAYGAMGMGLMYGGNFIASILFEIIGVTKFQSEASNQEYINQLFNTTLPGLIILFIVIVIMAPILEELVFRKAIFRLFKNKYLAMIVSSLIFGMLHVISPAIETLMLCFSGEATYLNFICEIIYIIPYSLMGLGLCIAFVKSENNVNSSIFAHMINNGISYILSYLMVAFPEIFELLEESTAIILSFIF